MDHRRWKILPRAPADYLKGMGLHPLAAQLLHNRGIANVTEAQAFFDVDDLASQGDPFIIPDMGRAVSRIQRALLSGETMAVFGDFDADGICGTVLLVEGLSRLGAQVIPYIPHRVQEGYGLNPVSLDSLAGQGVSLVITVDCGISDVAEVDYGRRIGLDIIITDHHTVPPELPKALAVVNPKRIDSAYPHYQLAGVGVAFKLMQALFRSLGKEHMVEELLDVVTVGTVADMVPLLGENRYLVKTGLKSLEKTSRVGLQEMMRTSGLLSRDIDTQAISWSIAPRLNAPGRLDHAVAGYRLLVTDSVAEAQQLALDLEEANAQRQKLTSDFLLKAKEQLVLDGTDAAVLIVGGVGYPPGVAGLIAGKLAEEFYRPSLVFETSDEMSKGSARSIPEFNMVSALMECGHILERFGGHPMAAGFTVRNSQIAELKDTLLQIATRRLAGIDLCPSLTIEAEVQLSSINSEVLKTIQKFAPFGNSNPVPVFLSRGVKVLQSSPVGNGSKHLKLKLKQGGVVWQAIGFDLGHLTDEVNSEVDIVYSLSVDRWGGRNLLELNILDFAPVR